MSEGIDRRWGGGRKDGRAQEKETAGCSKLEVLTTGKKHFAIM